MSIIEHREGVGRSGARAGATYRTYNVCMVRIVFGAALEVVTEEVLAYLGVP
jgi:hypothetical protein